MPGLQHAVQNTGLCTGLCNNPSVSMQVDAGLLLSSTKEWAVDDELAATLQPSLMCSFGPALNKLPASQSPTMLYTRQMRAGPCETTTQLARR